MAPFTYFRYRDNDAALEVLQPLRHYTDSRGATGSTFPRADPG